MEGAVKFTDDALDLIDNDLTMMEDQNQEYEVEEEEFVDYGDEMELDLDDMSDSDEEEPELIDLGEELQVTLSDEELILENLKEGETPPEDLFEEKKEESFMQ